jgi:hypothetical protein
MYAIESSHYTDETQPFYIIISKAQLFDFSDTSKNIPGFNICSSDSSKVHINRSLQSYPT